jgi:hypothetical protein
VTGSPSTGAYSSDRRHTHAGLTEPGYGMPTTNQVRQPQVRQNPDPRGANRPSPPGRERTPEWCPWHGSYVPGWNVFRLQQRARSGEDSVDTSRYRLDMAARLRRTCPECRDLHPTGPQWALIVRYQVDQLKRFKWEVGGERK